MTVDIHDDHMKATDAWWWGFLAGTLMWLPIGLILGLAMALNRS